MVKKYIAFLITAILTILGVNLVPSSSQAAEASQFNPGLIISDSIFFDGSSMASNAVQVFLEAKVPSCLSGYTCLKDYRQSTPNMPSRAGFCSAYQGSSAERASDIIAKVGVACGISPKVILVLLQKEQGLVLDDWPLSSQYQHATGFACPDTAPCDPNYSGFFNQVYSAAYQLKNYGVNNSSFNYHPGQINTILYNPNRDCGTSDIYIHNQATANLYIYTPYQPNSAALNNLYGSGDSCSAYGNRNFWRIFTDWFGATVEGHEYAITSLYISQGGQSGPLGVPVSGFIRIESSGGGWVQAFQNAAITYKSGVGAHVVTGTLRAQYNSKFGGIAGVLGWPVTSANSFSTSGGASVQGFESGALVVLNGASEAFALTSRLRTAFSSAGGAASTGWPTSDALCNGSKCWQKFQSANLYLTDSSYVKLTDPFKAKFESLQGTSGVLGWPTSNLVSSAASGGGQIHVFENGVITKSTTGNPVLLTGKLRTYFNSLGGLGGAVGWPKEDPSCSNSVCVQVFQNATLTCPESGSCSTSPQPPTPSPPSAGSGPTSIDQAYASAGGAAVLGQPVTGYNSISTGGGGIVRGYAQAAIAWFPDNGAFVLSGGLRQSFNKVGGFGVLGWPTSNSTCAQSGACSQSFTRGLLTWSAATSGNIILQSLAPSYVSNGGVTGSLGAATTGTISVAANGGGVVQAFSSGALAKKNSAPSGFVLSGAIRSFYALHGGVSGNLGWPTSNQVCSVANSCSQTFERGTIDWTLSNGAALR